jgi:hypothetical protein
MLPRLFSASDSTPISDPKVNQGLSNRLSQEVLAVTFYQATGGNYTAIRRHTNKKLIDVLGLNADALKQLDQVRPLSSTDLANQSQLVLINRSAKLNGPTATKQLPVLTLIFNGNMVSDPSSDTAIAVDLTQDFLQKTLKLLH